MDSKGRYYDEESLRREVIEPELKRENRAERRKREAIQRTQGQRRPDKAAPE